MLQTLAQSQHSAHPPASKTLAPIYNHNYFTGSALIKSNQEISPHPDPTA